MRQKALKLYLDGAGLRRTARQLGVHHRTVANWTKAQAEQLPAAPVPAKVKAAEFDELFTYIGDKKTESISLRLSIERRVAFWAGKWLGIVRKKLCKPLSTMLRKPLGITVMRWRCMPACGITGVAMPFQKAKPIRILSKATTLNSGIIWLA